MSVLRRKAVRDVRAMGLRAVMVVAVIAAGAGTAAGISLALDNVRATRDAFYDTQRLADVDLRLRRPIAAERLRARARAVDASAVETRLIVDGEASLPDGEQRSAELVGMRPEPRLNRLAQIEGEPLVAGRPNGAVLEADFAEETAVAVGERLGLRVGDRELTVRVRGTAQSPEYLLASSNPEYLLPRPGSLAVVFLPKRTLERLLGLAGSANDLAVDLPAGQAREAARRLGSGLPVEQVTPRARQFSLLFTEADVHSFSTFAPVMGGVFAIVGFLLVLLSLRRLVHAQRRELGALLALGYPRTVVALTVIMPAAILAALGALLSLAVAVGIGALVGSEYTRTVGFPEIQTSLSAAPLAIGAAAALAATLLAAAIPAWGLARLRPTEAMRGDAPAAFEIGPWLERATAHGGLALAYAARTLLRRPMLTSATVLSIAAAIGLGAAMNVVLTSTDDAVASTFSGQRWTHSLDLARPLPRQRARALALAAGARRVETVLKGPAQLRSAGGSEAQPALVAIARHPPLQRLDLSDGGPPAPGGIVLSEQKAGNLGVKVGDTLRIATTEGSARVGVSGIARTLANDQSYMLRGDAGPLLGAPDAATNLLVAARPGVAERLRRSPAVGRVTSRSATERDAHELIDELTALIDVLLAISLGVGALFLISSLTLSFLDRQGEFATLRALGYGRRQIAAIVGGEALTQTVLAAALSIPLALLIAWPLTTRIGEAWFRIGIVSEPPDFALAIVPALALASLAAVFAVRRVLRLDIARAVRARLVG